MNINILEPNSQPYQPSQPYSMAHSPHPSTNFTYVHSQISTEEPTK